MASLSATAFAVSARAFASDTDCFIASIPASVSASSSSLIRPSRLEASFSAVRAPYPRLDSLNWNTAARTPRTAAIVAVITTALCQESCFPSRMDFSFRKLFRSAVSLSTSSEWLSIGVLLVVSLSLVVAAMENIIAVNKIKKSRIGWNLNTTRRRKLSRNLMKRRRSCFVWRTETKERVGHISER